MVVVKSCQENDSRETGAEPPITKPRMPGRFYTTRCRPVKPETGITTVMWVVQIL